MTGYRIKMTIDGVSNWVNTGGWDQKFALENAMLYPERYYSQVFTQEQTQQLVEYLLIGNPGKDVTLHFEVDELDRA